MIDDILQPFEILEYHVYLEKVVPVINDIKGLENALKTDPFFDSKILNKPKNTAEGIVIQPYKKVYQQQQSTFMLKVKNEAFKEKQKEKKLVVVDSEVERLKQEFLTYVNNNRLQSVFSKHGVIEGKQQIGEYLKLLIEDATEDFLKEFEDQFNQLDKGQQKQVRNIGNYGFNLLKEYL